MIVTRLTYRATAECPVMVAHLFTAPGRRIIPRREPIAMMPTSLILLVAPLPPPLVSPPPVVLTLGSMRLAGPAGPTATPHVLLTVSVRSSVSNGLAASSAYLSAAAQPAAGPGTSASRRTVVAAPAVKSAILDIDLVPCLLRFSRHGMAKFEGGATRLGRGACRRTERAADSSLRTCGTPLLPLHSRWGGRLARCPTADHAKARRAARAEGLPLRRHAASARGRHAHLAGERKKRCNELKGRTYCLGRAALETSALRGVAAERQLKTKKYTSDPCMRGEFTLLVEAEPPLGMPTRQSKPPPGSWPGIRLRPLTRRRAAVSAGG